MYWLRGQRDPSLQTKSLLLLLLEASRGTLGGRGKKRPSSFSILVLKMKSKKKNFQVGEDTLPQNSQKPSWTYEKLHCKGEPHRFSGQPDPLLQTKKNRKINLAYSNKILWFKAGRCLKSLASVYVQSPFSLLSFIGAKKITFHPINVQRTDGHLELQRSFATNNITI